MEVIQLMEFWQEFPPTFMLVRGAVGYKPDSSVVVKRQRQVEPSDHFERLGFVKQWGGQLKHTDSLPSHVQEAFALAFAQADKEKTDGQ